MGAPLRAAQALVNTLWRAGTGTSEEKAVTPLQTTIPGSGGWLGLVRESFAGAWQRNIEIRTDSVLTYPAAFRCITLISSDIGKMRMRLVEQDTNGIWKETSNPAFSPVLRKPNRYQTRIQFFTSWMESKLIHGNTYVLKERDARSVVTRLYVLHPELVTVLVAPDGAVFYELRADNLAGIAAPNRVIRVPASEIIHDRWNTLNHPLVGTSPIHACGLAATQGLRIQENSTRFFASGSHPGGMLSAPGRISEDTAQRLKEYWDQNYGAGGPNVGKVAVLGDGLKYEPMTISAADSELLGQLKWTAEVVASVFGVPAFKIGVGNPPTYNNIEALDAQYYSQCLQIHIENIEECLDDGLGLGPRFGNAYGSEFDLSDLLRMDTATKVKAARDAVGSGAMAPNEARFRYFDLGPVEGGQSPYLQIQNYSLAALNRRDQETAPVTPGLSAPPDQETDADGNGGDDQPTEVTEEERQRSLIVLTKAIERSARDYECRRIA